MPRECNVVQQFTEVNRSTICLWFSNQSLKDCYTIFLSASVDFYFHWDNTTDFDMRSSSGNVGLAYFLFPLLCFCVWNWTVWLTKTLTFVYDKSFQFDNITADEQETLAGADDRQISESPKGATFMARVKFCTETWRCNGQHRTAERSN